MSSYKPLVAWQAAEVFAIQCSATTQKPLIKELLRKVLGKALLTFSELNALLIQIEGIINSRPLTAVSDDCRDPLPVTPAHLAIGRPINQLPESKEESLEESSKRTVERYLYLQRLLNYYCKRWQWEHLHLLSVRSKWQEENPSIWEGDIVLVSDDNVCIAYQVANGQSGKGSSW